MYDDGNLNELLKSSLRHSLLERAEEKACSERVAELQAWCSVRDDLAAELHRQPTHDEWARALGFHASSPAQAVEILEAQLRERRKAKTTLVRSNLRLVVFIAKRFAGRGVPFEDLVQEGTIGLIKAADKFEPERGFRFSTYATYWIRQACQRAVEADGLPIRLPAYMLTRIGHVRREIARGHAAAPDALAPPTVEACVRDLQLSPRQLRRTLDAMEVTRPLVSLDATLARGPGDSDRTVLSTLADERDAPCLREARERTQALQAVLDATLSAEEARIVRLKYGLADGPKRATRQIAEELGCSSEHVHAVGQRSLRKLRRAARKSNWESIWCDAV